MELESSLPRLQVPATCSYPESDQFSQWHPHPTSWRSILILPSHLRLGLPSGFFPSSLSTKSLHAPLLFPIRATCSFMKFVLMLSLKKYLVRNTDDKASLYVVFATLLPHNTSKTKISSSEPYYRTVSAYNPPPFLRPSLTLTQNNRQNYSSG